MALPLLDLVQGRGFAVKVAIMDKGYDQGPIHDGCMDRGVAPLSALIETSRVKRGEHKPPTCEHGEWTFAGADYKRKATKWRCPTGKCTPASRWIKADRLHPLFRVLPALKKPTISPLSDGDWLALNTMLG